MGKTSFGGKGVTITEVLTFLRSTSPKQNYNRGQLNFGASSGTGSKGKEKGVFGWQNEKIVSQVLADAYLANGHALAVAFLGTSYRNATENMCQTMISLNLFLCFA